MTALSRREQNRLDKHKRLLDAALTVFARDGYGAATMDQIAAQAGLSKPTLYQYFESKDELFKAMMLTPREQMMLAFDTQSDADHVSQLWSFAWTYADIVMQPEFLSLARLIIGDAQRFPEIGRAYQANGPDKVLEGLTNFMQHQANLGRLQLEDAELAAEDFWGLILSAPRNKALHMPDAIPNKTQLARYVHNGLTVFLKAYSKDSKKDLGKLKNLINENTKENPKEKPTHIF